MHHQKHFDHDIQEDGAAKTHDRPQQRIVAQLETPLAATEAALRVARARGIPTLLNAAPARDGLARAQYADLKIWLPGDILTKVDRTSMSIGLEAREPLLDHRLVEFAATLPANLRLRGGEGKWLMKKAMEGHVPDDILYRPKMGFVSPISAWFRGPLAAEAEALMARSRIADSGWFRMDILAKCNADHRSGLGDHGRLLWQLVMLEKSLARLFG